ncbi:MAG: hypothetical protein J7621_16225 [Niastella sp.]|nr:hypothetical protein [Niastella sp.]
MKNLSIGVIMLTTMVLFSSCQSQPGLGLNDAASLHSRDELPENPLLLHAITSGVQPKDSTMYTLYGNDAAFIYAGSHGDSSYPDGAVLYEVTWQQQADEQWAGAHVPKKIVYVERLEYAADGQATYTLYRGTPLKKAAAANPALRAGVIAGQRMAVSP